MTRSILLALALLAIAPLTSLIAAEASQSAPEPVRLHTAYGVQYREYSIFNPARKPASAMSEADAAKMRALYVEVR